MKLYYEMVKQRTTEITNTNVLRDYEIIKQRTVIEVKRKFKNYVANLSLKLSGKLVL